MSVGKKSLKLDFIIVGVMKCGTTSLGEYLMHHENIAIPVWEVGFFNKPIRFNQGYEYYEDCVEKYADEKTLIRGEKTPYSFDKNITPKIHAYNPDIKLVFILRNPVDRAWSNYGHDLWNLDEKLSFKQCLKEEGSRDLLYQYKSKGRYLEQIEDFLQYYKREQIHVIIFEDFLKDRKKELKKLFNFLEVPSDNYDYDVKIHSKKSYHPKYNPKMLHAVKSIVGKNNKIWNYVWNLNFKDKLKKKISADIRQDLVEYYKPYNDKLEQFLGRKLEDWNK